MYRPPPPPGNYSPYGTPPMPAATPAAAPWGAPPMSVWKEHTTPEGKKYWYNTATRASTWEKPDELLTPEERVLKTSAWKEYTTPEGKKYYSNVKTKETVWEIPAELKQQIEKARKEALENRVVEQPTPLPPVRPIVPTLPPMPMTSQLIDQTTVPEFTSREQAEKAFHGLLKETGVKSDWSWDQAMRAIITNPLYRALKTTAERKAAFHRWAEAEAKREREEKEHRETRQRNNFFSMLRHQKDNIKSYTRYRTLAKLCGHLSAYQAVPDRQREIYFDEFIQQVQREEKDRLRDLRKESMDKFSKLLRSIPEISYKTSWKEAQALYLQKQKQEHVSLEGMDMLDFLSVFEEYNRTLWEEPMQELNNKIFKRRRKERKAREGFRQLLQELVERRQINVRTLWKEIYPVIKDDPRFLSAVGLPDSTPLDMFWDVIDALDEELYQQKKLVYHSLKKSDYDVGLESSFEDYLNALDEQVKTEVSQDNLRFVFEHLQAKAAQRIKDEKRRQEKKHRKKLDIFRYALKHAIPPIQLEETWEQVKSRVEHLEEYKELEEEYRQEVFDRYMKRLKVNKREREKKKMKPPIHVYAIGKERR
ncbi:uncharacterized protein B0P05DRAFT_523202 [Gilbertella persicaria]|uniref:uncharacterized protein n=1 Tax=Gilbertella persicaria TaxID=101096 RepID=UPI00222125CA|nr:uncharacterized protein B0P05DRAFT_523202 [Gilbertella persicaria]KAI8098062.1 hypothetical protein B0P05DRAFT_523202 [Gilbertella persicaria]